MTFYELLSVVSEKHPETVPCGAEGHLKQCISEATEERLLSLPMDEAVMIIVGTVEAINHGAVETIEELIEGKIGSRG